MTKSSILLHHIPTTTHSTAIATATTTTTSSSFSHHTQTINSNQCTSTVTQRIPAPISIVWSVVRRFDAPQVYKHFIRNCDVISGNGDVGTLRRVRVVSGLPAGTSDERLEILDDQRHVISFSIIGGDHRLSNYRSITALHEIAEDNEESTMVVESYVVDIPTGNSKEETCVFVDTIVKCNLQSLSQIAENLLKRERELKE